MRRSLDGSAFRVNVPAPKPRLDLLHVIINRSVLHQISAIMQLPLAANEKLAHAPVDIINLDRDDFRRAQPEPRHQKHHGIVAPPKRRIRLDGRDHCFHLLRR